MSVRDWLQTDLNWRRTVIWGSAEAIDALIDCIDAGLSEGWVRDRSAETLYKVRGGEVEASLCYIRSLGEGEVRLWLNRPSRMRLVGANVIPSQNLVEYNRHAAETISEFRTLILEPQLPKTGAQIELNEIGTRSHVSSVFMDRLRELTESPERTFPLAEQRRDRWRTLIVEAWRSNAAVDPDELHMWLTRHQWSPTHAHSFVSALYEDMRLLSAYDEARQPA